MTGESVSVGGEDSIQWVPIEKQLSIMRNN